LSYSTSRFLWLYLLWWTFWSLVQIIVLHRFNIVWEIALLDAMISNFMLALICFTAILLFRYYQPGAGNRFYRFAFAIGITLVYANGLKFVLNQVFKDDEIYLNFIAASMPLRFVFSLMMLSFVTIINWMWSSIEEKSKLALQQKDAEQLLKEAELVKLRQQLQPHFLFNSLNSISALAGSEPQLARKMIQQLSDFLRGTLKKDEEEKVNLTDELKQLNLYLEIEKVRFGERLLVNIDCKENALNAKIPPLLLQPIVENAIKFGLYDTIDQVIVQIQIELKQNDLLVRISNPFDPTTAKASKGTGFGLNFIQRRLFLLYAQNNLLTTQVNENTFITQIIIPQ